MISLYELYVKYTWIRGLENANGLELAPNLVIIKDVKFYTLLLSQMHYINGKIIEEYLGPNQAQLITMHVQSEIPDKGRPIKEMVVWYLPVVKYCNIPYKHNIT